MKSRAELIELIGKPALTALEAAGLAVVPVVATEEMRIAGNEADGWMDDPEPIYTAMLNARPFKE